MSLATMEHENDKDRKGQNSLTSNKGEEKETRQQRRRHRSSSGSKRRERKSESYSKPLSQRSKDRETEVLWHRNRHSSAKEDRGDKPTSKRRSKEEKSDKSSSSRRSRAKDSIQQKRRRRRKSKDDLLNISSETEILWHRNGPSKPAKGKDIPKKPSSASSLAAGTYIPNHLKVEIPSSNNGRERLIASIRRNSVGRERASSERSERKIEAGIDDVTKPPRAPKRKSRLPPSRSKSSDAIGTSFYWQREPSNNPKDVDTSSTDRSSLNKGSIALIAQQLQRTNEKEQSLLEAVSTLRGRRMPKGRGRTTTASPRTSLERKSTTPRVDSATSHRERHHRSLSRDKTSRGQENKSSSGHSRSDRRRKEESGEQKNRSDSKTRSSGMRRKPPRKSSSFDSGTKNRSRRKKGTEIEDDTMSTAETLVISNR